MSTEPSTSTLHSNFMSVFNAALEAYKRKTKKDLASHPLLPTLQSCNSPEAILTVLREQIPGFTESQNADDGLTKWVTPTVNVLYAFSDTLGQGIGLAFPSANVIFAGIGVLLSTAKDAGSSRDKLIEVFNRIEHFFHRLEIYTGITPTAAMRDIIVEIMVEVLTILGIATKEVKCGRVKRFLKTLTGNTDIANSLDKLDKLTREEARMASAELLKMTHSIDGKVMGVDDRVKGVERKVQDVCEDVRGDVQDVREDVQDVRDDVQDIRNDVHDVLEDVQDVRGNVQDVGNRVQGVDDRVQGIGIDVNDKLDQVNWNQLRDSLSRWLSAPNTSTNHNNACKARHNGTAQWFFQGSIFNQWKSAGPFLWVHGKPGSGKSILCSSIIQDITALCDEGRAIMAYFYFDFRDVDKQRLSNLLPSLLIQLSASSDSCCDILSRLYIAHKRGVEKPSDRAMVECLKEMLSLDVQGPTYIIMDALDECPITSTIPSPREEVLDFVDELVGLHLPNVHICVTSRPEHDIQAVLKDLALRAVSLHDESGQQEDIVNYVTCFVRSDRKVRRWREEDKDLLIKTLSEKADGMFRWVFCQLEVLRHCFPSSVRVMLEELPESLDGTYERILREITKPNQGHAHRLMQCLVAAVRPLEVKELAEVLAFDFNVEGIPKLNPSWRWEDHEEAVMSACSSLVTIVKDGKSRVVQFSHFSVKEFLTANRLVDPIKDVSRYHIRLEAAHTILAQACLGVLLRLDDSIDRDKIENFPLARYAAQYWPTHARVENVSSRISDGMECLFDADKPHFATWLWIFNEDRGGDSMRTTSPEKPEAVPLYHAARLGFRALAEHLIAEHPEHVNARGGDSVTPVWAAYSAGHADISLFLLELGADLDAPVGSYNMNPLHQASMNGQPETVQWLLDHGAKIDARERDDWTPLHWAVCTKNSIQVVRILLERGADVNARDNYGETPIGRAKKHWQGNVEQGIVELLSKYGTKSVE